MQIQHTFTVDVDFESMDASEERARLLRGRARVNSMHEPSRFAIMAYSAGSYTQYCMSYRLGAIALRLYRLWSRQGLLRRVHVCLLLKHAIPFREIDKNGN